MSKIIISKKAKLSKRQYEIIILRAMGLKYTEIESRLKIGKKTLKNHLLASMHKFNVISQNELIEFARTQKWIVSQNMPTGEIEHRIKEYSEIAPVRIIKQFCHV